MKFPDRKLSQQSAVKIATSSPVDLSHLDVDPNRPHRWMGDPDHPDDVACRACRGSYWNPIHLEPIGGWR